MTIPGELFPKLGLALKDRLRRAGAKWAGVIGLDNDELGYILPEEDFRYPLNPLRPGNHYEETNSVGKAIGPAVVTAVEALLRKHTVKKGREAAIILLAIGLSPDENDVISPAVGNKLKAWH